MTQGRKRKSRRARSAVEIEVTLPTLVTSCRSTIRAAGRHLPCPPTHTGRADRRPVANGPVAPAWGRPSATHSGGFYWHPCRLSASVPSPRPERCDEPRQTPAMRIALYQPDIPQNTGTVLRLCACLGIEAHLIEPAGFLSSDRAFRRAGMDYLDAVVLVRHASWRQFEDWRRQRHCRLVVFTTAATTSYLDHRFQADEVLLFGRESAGVPQDVHAAADARLVIPMQPGLRSLNVAMAAAMAAGEALRQIGGMPQASTTPGRPLSTT